LSKFTCKNAGSFAGVDKNIMCNIRFSVSMNYYTDYCNSPSSVIVVVVLLVVAAGYVFLRDGWSDLVQSWTKDATPKTRRTFLSHDLDPKVKGQNQRSNSSYCNQS